MHYLVTGAAGFLGANLAERLLSQGHQVTGLDNFHSGSKEHMVLLKQHPCFTFLEHDVVQPYKVNCDIVCNLACPASPPHYQRDPVYTAKIAFLGTLHALENAERCRARLLQASTSEVYGDPLVHPQSEAYLGQVNLVGPRACYDEGKRLGETLCADFQRLGRVDARIVRIFNTYGPKMRKDDGRVVTNFIQQALAGKPLTVYGRGQQTRSFCYVDDLITGFLKVLEHSENLGPVNLGNPHEVSMLRLAQVIQELTASKSALEFLPLPVDDPKQRCPDITKAKTHLQWEPQISLEEGLTKTIAYFKNLAPR
jgi:UDP-glucuronate decarboxylase